MSQTKVDKHIFKCIKPNGKKTEVHMYGLNDLKIIDKFKSKYPTYKIYEHVIIYGFLRRTNAKTYNNNRL